MNVIDRSELNIDEWHPCADSAIHFITSKPMDELLKHREALASCALSGNRLAEVCHGTLNRIINRDPVSDRYVLGLAWYIKESDGK